MALVSGAGDDGFTGAVWQFTRRGGGWAQDGPKLTPVDSVGTSEFGTSLSLSADGSTLIVGGSGVIWIYTRSGSGWSQQQKASVPDQGLAAAVALSADGSYALVADSRGAPGVLPSAWGFARTGSTWVQDGQSISAFPYADGSDSFGSSVAMTGDGAHTLVGDPGLNRNAPRNDTAGALFAFAKPPPPSPHGGGGGGGGSSSIAVALSPSTQTVASGGSATWSVSVTNTGGAYLSAVTIVDPAAPSGAPPAEDADALSFMAPQLTITYPCTDANVTNSFTNTVSVLGVTGPGDAVRANADAQVIVATPTPQPLPPASNTASASTTSSSPAAQPAEQTIAVQVRVLRVTKLRVARPAITCRLTVSAKTRLILVLRDAHGRRLASWTEAARKGLNSFVLHLPRPARHPGHDVLWLAGSARMHMAPKAVRLVV